MVTVNISKIKKSVLPTIARILNVLQKMGLSLFEEACFFLDRRLISISQKHETCSFLNEAACACVNMRNCITLQVSNV